MSTIKQPDLFDNDLIDADHSKHSLRAPFPYFGGKSSISSLIWFAFGKVKQYIEPFCGSAAMLLANPEPASLEVVGDVNCYIANFWRAVKHQPDAVAAEADYPVSHIDLAARHRWLVEPERVAELAAKLADAEWPGDAKVAGWWCWGQCAWIGSGWCDSERNGSSAKIPHVTSAGQGVQKIPFIGHAGRGMQSGGCRIPAIGAGKGIQSRRGESTQIPHLGSAGQGVHSSSFDGAGIAGWMHELADRLKRVRIIHGAWDRCLNMHYGNKGESAAVFLDPPYVAFESLYGKQDPVAIDVAKWAAARPEVRIAACGHVGDYDEILVGWESIAWDRGRLTYGGAKTTASEAIWFSPACRRVTREDE